MHIKMLRSVPLWGALFVLLSLFFYHFAPVTADALSDEQTTLRLKTDDGVTTVTLAEYLPHAVAAEMPVSFGEEALKAQTVAIRTYALASHRHGDADICTDSGCCLAYKSPDELDVLWGADSEKNLAAVTAAVAATDGEYLAYDGEVIQAVFHASSAGRTEDSAALWTAQPYLISVDSPETAQSVPGLITTLVFTPDELSALLGLSAPGAPDTWLGAAQTDASGRVQSLTLCGRQFAGTELRTALGLKSTDFTAMYDGERFVFTVSGSGHGVGMSQYGAKLLADQGMTYRDILSHYYPGTAIVSP